MHHQQVGVARGEQVGPDADRRRRKEAVGRSLDRVGQLHAANVVVLRGAQQAGFRIGATCFISGLRQHHAQRAIGLGFGARLFQIDQPVERRVLLAGDALGGVEHSIEGLTRMVGKARTLLQRLGLKPLVEQEIQGVAQGGGHAEIMGNAAPQSLSCARRAWACDGKLNPLALVRHPRAKVLLLGRHFKMRNFSKEPSWPQP